MKTTIARLALAATAILTATIGCQSIARSAPTTGEVTFGGLVAGNCVFSKGLPSN